jgi:hypothetical protein
MLGRFFGYVTAYALNRGNPDGSGVAGGRNERRAGSGPAGAAGADAGAAGADAGAGAAGATATAIDSVGPAAMVKT